MSGKRILVAYDGSAASLKAIEIAREIVEANPQSEVLLVHVMRLFSSGAAASGIDTMILDDVQSIKEELEGAAETIGGNVTIQLLKGSSPSDLILEFAKTQDCDMIIMGSRGKGGVGGYLGSVSYAVIKESPVTVIVAKEAR